MIKKTLFLIFIISITVALAGDLTARQILDKAINRYRGDDSKMTAIITKSKLSNPDSVKKFNVTTYRKVRPDVIKGLIAVSKAGDPNSRPILFLVWDWQAEGKQDQIWYCLPSIGKYDKINSKRGEDMANRFGVSVDELRARDLDDAVHTLEPDAVEQGEQCYKIISVPNDPNKEGIRKITSFIRKESFTPVRIIVTGLDGKMDKRLTITRLEKVDDIWAEMAGRFEDYKKDQLVTFEVKDIEYNPSLSNSLFSFTEPPAELIK